MLLGEYMRFENGFGNLCLFGIRLIKCFARSGCYCCFMELELDVDVDDYVVDVDFSGIVMRRCK